MMDELETGGIPILHFGCWSQMKYLNDGGHDMVELDVECRVVKGQVFTVHPTRRTSPGDRAAPPAREGVIPAPVVSTTTTSSNAWTPSSLSARESHRTISR